MTKKESSNANHALSLYFTRATQVSLPEQQQQQPLALDPKKETEQASNPSLEALFKSSFATQISQQESKENAILADIVKQGLIRNPDLALGETLPSEFQALSCKIGGFQFAIPLIELGRIIKLSSSAELKNKNSCNTSRYKGMLIDGQKSYQCLNEDFWFGKTAIPEPIAKDKFFMQLGKSTLVVECSELGVSKKVSQAGVKWHNTMHQKPWIVGVVKDSMEMILDMARLVEKVLDNADNMPNTKVSTA